MLVASEIIGNQLLARYHFFGKYFHNTSKVSLSKQSSFSSYLPHLTRLESIPLYLELMK
jgi:hypothetical protein